MSKNLNRADFMSAKQRYDMPLGMARTHVNCIAKVGVARPGKTAHDRAKKQK